MCADYGLVIGIWGTKRSAVSDGIVYILRLTISGYSFCYEIYYWLGRWLGLMMLQIMNGEVKTLAKEQSDESCKQSGLCFSDFFLLQILCASAS